MRNLAFWAVSAPDSSPEKSSQKSLSDKSRSLSDKERRKQEIETLASRVAAAGVPYTPAFTNKTQNEVAERLVLVFGWRWVHEAGAVAKTVVPPVGPLAGDDDSGDLESVKEDKEEKKPRWQLAGSDVGMVDSYSGIARAKVRVKHYVDADDPSYELPPGELDPDAEIGWHFGRTKDVTKILSIENPVVYIKKFPHGLYKVVEMLDIPVGNQTGTKNVFDDDVGRFEQNITRAKTAVEEYGLCNDFKYFVTFTISPRSQDRSDLGRFRQRLTQMVRDYRRRKGADIQYLLVPELHRDGENWHIHGLMNMPETLLSEYTKEMSGFERLPYKIRTKVLTNLASGSGRCFRWLAAEKTFGWNTIEEIRDPERSTRYLLKYFEKEQRKTAERLEKGDNLYFVSHGLKKAERIEKTAELLEQFSGKEVDFQTSGAYCVLKWYRLTETLNDSE